MIDQRRLRGDAQTRSISTVMIVILRCKFRVLDHPARWSIAGSRSEPVPNERALFSKGEFFFRTG